MSDGLDTSRLPRAEAVGRADASGAAGDGGTSRPDLPGMHRALRRLEYRPPLSFAGLLAFLGPRAVPGVEEVVDGTYRRTLRLPGGPGVVELRQDALGDEHAGEGSVLPAVTCVLLLADPADAADAVRRCRRLLDLEADPAVVDARLAEDPVLAPRVLAEPGRRSPGTVDGDELAVRAVLGQQVSVAAARTQAGRLVSRLGERLPEPSGGLTHLFPDMATLAVADEDHLPGMPASRRRTLLGVARAVADEGLRLKPGPEADAATQALLRVPGIGPWTATYVRMRALGDPDAFLSSDLGVRHALDRCGLPSDPRSAARRSEVWAPWRSYAVHHLWASLAAGG